MSAPASIPKAIMLNPVMGRIPMGGGYTANPRTLPMLTQE
jgi:hypothetical protein